MSKHKYFIGFKMDDHTYTYYAGSQETARKVFQNYWLVEQFKTEPEALKRLESISK